MLALPAVGLISNSLHYVSGIDTPENKAFVDAYATKHKRLPSWFAESAYTAGLWIKTAVDKIEALIRWNHPDRGMVPPAEFIPLGRRGLASAVIDAGDSWRQKSAG